MLHYLQAVTIRSQVSRPFENDLALLCEAMKAPAVFNDLNAETLSQVAEWRRKGPVAKLDKSLLPEQNDVPRNML